MPKFTTETFQGRGGIIDPILDEFTNRGHFLHYHVTVHQGCTELAEQARYALREREKSVIYFDGNSQGVFVPEMRFPGSDKDVYAHDREKKSFHQTSHASC